MSGERVRAASTAAPPPRRPRQRLRDRTGARAARAAPRGAAPDRPATAAAVFSSGNLHAQRPAALGAIRGLHRSPAQGEALAQAGEAATARRRRATASVVGHGKAHATAGIGNYAAAPPLAHARAPGPRAKSAAVNRPPGRRGARAMAYRTQGRTQSAAVPPKRLSAIIAASRPSARQTRRRTARNARGPFDPTGEAREQRVAEAHGGEAASAGRRERQRGAEKSGTGATATASATLPPRGTRWVCAQ